MKTKDTVKLVEDRINEERLAAEERVKELKNQGKPLKDQDIVHFFPELSQAKSEGKLESWGNRPRIPLPHYLIVGMQAVFDLEPLERKQFLSEHRIDVKAAEYLVERMLLLPNLYIRDPKKWEGKEHLNRLLKKAWVNGERVDHYLRARDDKFDDMVNRREEFLKGIWIGLDNQTQKVLAGEANVRQTEDVPMVVGKRWAYLDVLEPLASEDLESLFEEYRYVDAFKYLGATKHLFASPITAALGGHFVWGPHELKKLEAANQSQNPLIRYQCDVYLPLSENVLRYPEAIEYVLHEITRTKPFEVLKEWEFQRLQRVLEDPNLETLRPEIHKTLYMMMYLARTGGNLDPKIKDFAKIAQEFQKQLDSYQRVGSATVDQVFVSVGGLIGGILGGAIGSTTGAVEGAVGGGRIGKILAASIPPEVKNKVGTLFYRVKNPDRHRVVMTLQQLREIAQG